MKSLFYYYQAILVPASTLLPITAGLVFYKRINKPLRALLIYLIGAFTINVCAIIVASRHVNNLPGLHFYTIFEVLAVMYYYKTAFNESSINKWINIIMVAFPIYCVINFTFFQSIFEFNTYTRPVGAFIIIVISIIYLSIQGDLKKQELITSSGRTVAAGFLIYLCSSLFQFIFSNAVSQYASKQVKMWIWGLHATFVLIMYIFFFVAILNDRSKR